MLCCLSSLQLTKNDPVLLLYLTVGSRELNSGEGETNMSACRIFRLKYLMSVLLTGHSYYHRVHRQRREISKLYKPSVTRLHSQWKLSKIIKIKKSTPTPKQELVHSWSKVSLFLGLFVEVIIHTDLERYVGERFYREYLQLWLELFTLESSCVTEARMPDKQSHRTHLWLWNEHLFSGWAGRKHSWGEEKSKACGELEMALALKTWMKYCSEGRVNLSQLPVVWLSFQSDSLPALIQVQVLPPFLHEMPCVLVCTRWSGPPPDTHCHGATSVPPGRC